MNISELYEMQKKLDDRIIEKHGLQGKDLLPKLILALQVELGELANEWRGFKFWSEDQEPRTYGLKLGKTPKENRYINPLLEEYVDCLHFLLSIGNNLSLAQDIQIDSDYTTENPITDMNRLFYLIAELSRELVEIKAISVQVYEEMFNLFVGVGEKHLGFTWDEVEKAYMNKNAINHVRQATGY
nr:dUTP diphosphatase [Aneurinibacillus sp. XH2]